MMVGREFGGVEDLGGDPLHRIAGGCGWFFFGEILVGSTDMDAVPPSGGTISCWRAS
jgi:hypothetical protein